MKAVSRFEANLLTILAFFLGRAPIERAMPLIMSRLKKPMCLSRQAVELVQDALSKGCVSTLARIGGWKKERFLRQGRIAEGRLWERSTTPELALSFSEQTLEFLVWITASVPGDTQAIWRPHDNEMTIGDRLLIYCAYEALRDTNVAKDFRRFPAIHRHGLILLMFPDDFTERKSSLDVDFEPWFGGQGQAVLEAFQSPLAERWLEIEAAKERMTDLLILEKTGRTCYEVIGEFLQGVDAAGRRDLARFLLRVVSRLLQRDGGLTEWAGRLNTTRTRLAERNARLRAAFCLLYRLPTLEEWQAQSRGVGYFDEGYAAAQLYKSDWEQVGGEELCDRARAVLRAVEPL